jgi:hypothetical protein
MPKVSSTPPFQTAKQTQFKPKQSQYKAKTNPIQTQTNPISAFN